METFSALLALCAGNSPVAGEFPAQRPVTRSFDVFFDLRLNEVNNREADNLRRPLGHYDVSVMLCHMCITLQALIKCSQKFERSTTLGLLYIDKFIFSQR